MGEKFVSILIPVYNRFNLVGESIESAINQTYKNIEIIIVDNCSTDGTWQVLENYAAKDSRIRIFKNSENIGPVLNWKRCIDEAKGEYAKILFSDDLISENFIEETLKLFDKDTAFVLSDIKLFKNEYTGDSSNIIVKNEYLTNEFIEDSIIYGINGFSVSPACAMFRNDDLKKSLLIDIPNPYNLDFKSFGAGNDLLLFLLTAIRYKKIRIAVNTNTFYRYHTNSLTVKNNLGLYYDYAKYHFIINYCPAYLEQFNFSLKLRQIRHKKSNEIVALIRKKFSILSFFIFVFKVLIKYKKTYIKI